MFCLSIPKKSSSDTINSNFCTVVALSYSADNISCLSAHGIIDTNELNVDFMVFGFCLVNNLLCQVLTSLSKAFTSNLC
jgi:hypothetical protein